MNIASDITALIGRTPLVELARYGKKYGVEARLVAKVEGVNPSGSVKARAALAMVEEAERCGVLCPGGTITSLRVATRASGLLWWLPSRATDLSSPCPRR